MLEEPALEGILKEVLETKTAAAVDDKMNPMVKELINSNYNNTALYNKINSLKINNELIDKIVKKLDSTTINPKKIEKNNNELFFFDNYKMVILVRKDLKMGVGKVAAQVGHAGKYKLVNNSVESL